MKVDDLKFGKCLNCGDEMIIRQQRQRFCSDSCRSAMWQRENTKKKKLMAARGPVDLFGFPKKVA